ncbi:hypothetical protein F5148DRAFT_619771 [Russula earlei]|uniref:Uncharacterized protein n=1 Tax=Russula earlei TaxID=71964 RepID=A0ACC0TWX1_9AGAM|nr:hypothetical protein F5148DRAFT_619771 [Russula earlei]
MFMDTSPGESQDHLRQDIDDELKSLEDSIRELKSRRNALAPISCLPPETLSVIFSFLSSSAWNIKADGFEWICVAHVCHHWREVALNHPRFWSYVNFTNLTSDGLAEILARAKMTPLHLMTKEFRLIMARSDSYWRQLEAHISHTRHLSLSGHSQFCNMLQRFVSSALILEHLSLSHYSPTSSFTIPDTLFNGTTPRLISLELNGCDISWKSPLLKGLRILEIVNPSTNSLPMLEDWLDALNELSQLKTLVLHYATPIASHVTSFIPEPQRTVTLPSVIQFNISAHAKDCALALAHLSLPALTWLHVSVQSNDRGGDDVRLVIPYIARNAHGTQDIEPLRSMLISGEPTRAELLAWTLPDADAKVSDPITLLKAAPSARVVFSAVGRLWHPGTDTAIIDALLMHLPMKSISTLSAQNHARLSKKLWISHAPSWPLLERARLAPTAVRPFREMLIEDPSPDGPRLPSLTKLILHNVSLTSLRTYHLRDMLIHRVEQGVPLEALDLRSCFAAVRAIQLLAEIVVDVQAPANTLEIDDRIYVNMRGNVDIFDEEEEVSTDDDKYDGGPGPWHDDSDEYEEDWDENDEDDIEYHDEEYYSDLLTDDL